MSTIEVVENGALVIELADSTIPTGHTAIFQQAQ